mgnify:CR=1 FL=1
MKIIETKGGQIFEISTLKEIIPYIMDNYINNKDFLDDDSSLFVAYKDGSSYYIIDDVEMTYSVENDREEITWNVE